MGPAREAVARGHDLLSLRLLQPLSRLQRRVRPSCRAALLAFERGLAFRAGAAGWSEEARARWVLGQLRVAVRRAERESAYYRDRLRRCGFDAGADFGFDDFARLPVLERADLHQHAERLVSRSVPPHQLRKDATGGSTGRPAEVWLGPEERGWQESGAEHYMRRIGAPRGSRVALLWGHHLDPVASDRLRDRLRDVIDNVRWFDCFRLSPALLARYHRALEDHRPAWVVAYASALAALADEVLERGWRPGYPTRGVVTGAEGLSAHQRRRVEAAFGRPVHARYGSREVGLMAFQARSGEAGYEVDWANVVVEPETPEPVASILVTKLHADGMPMLRYRVGDLARFAAGSRPGHPAAILHEVLGRELDRIWLPDGRWVHGIEFPHLMKDQPVREFQVRQGADFSVVLQAVAREGFTEEHRRRIAHTLSANLPGLPVQVEIVAAIPRAPSGKVRPVVSAVTGERGAA